MPKFVVVDNSLKGEGGHHLDYDANVLHAAERAGYAPVLAAHRKFSRPADLPRHWSVWPLFSHHAYCQYSVTVGSASFPSRLDSTGDAAVPWSPSEPWRGRPPGTWARIRQRWHRGRQTARWSSFAHACRRLFDRVPLAAGDQVFFPTMTDFDLVGLVEFLKDFRQGNVADWHLQFHYAFMTGREPEYVAQHERVAAMRSHFQHLWSQLPDLSLRCYATTRSLARQYDQLGVVPFHVLEYAVRPVATDRPPTASARSASQRLRILVAGGVRAEKGHAHLAQILNGLRDRQWFDGRLQIWIQAKRRSQIPFDDVCDLSLDALRDDRVPDSVPVVRVPHPLPEADYARLFHQVDGGLFLHDPRRYYHRCSGVLVEILAAGLPVVVPAACWLSDEIEEPVTARLMALAENSTNGEPLVGVAGRLDAWRCGTRAAPTELELPAPSGASYLLLEFRRPIEFPTGRYVAVRSVQGDRQGNGVRAWQVLLPGGAEGSVGRCVVPVHPRAARVSLAWSNAFDDELVTLPSLHYRFRSDVAPDSPYGPTSNVGLAATDAGQFVECLEELVRHFAHYRVTARAFAEGYAAAHHPDRVIETLMRPPWNWKHRGTSLP